MSQPPEHGHSRSASAAPPQQPIGVFDSGVGGLSVLHALRAALPRERFVYLADSANAPYGERAAAQVSARTLAITGYLRAQHRIKALVVACNTATAAAIDELRQRHPGLPLVGLEPALKPALALTQTGHVGVIGTRGTLGSAKFGKLLASLADRAHFVLQPCDGLAHAIERSVLSTAPVSGSTETGALCQRYLHAMGTFGKAPGQIDTLVLGCTHYLFVTDELRALLGPGVQFVETGAPVARQTRRLLETAGLLRNGLREPQAAAETAGTRLLTTGPAAMLQAAAQRWLGLPADCCTGICLP
ncbi:glutamate racemase [Verminephrobacter eiseniae]|uniref:Glutamate racemase n=1 Tax=Verminephrobacter eiseniae (strain EF01-2) TaxID=391735 RepID=A1WMT6_VEREI|nr:glutamate racemase [Verminephrobacter eiseniae]ABM58943.1 glutamate racemase [Verminephrobacter eiseniae EF01-2]MCW5284503.1 glutamate racemase [Verminephrobacter eiseniae]MCW5302209.1 glutamate racemase [Verminephrobacter eiseniae]MCW8182394.1 glutamate racemase [Verminephrobacter eiseniae]MCW8191787.1 glutamate racemase [Verminephrobacter eiseniae]